MKWPEKNLPEYPLPNGLTNDHITSEEQLKTLIDAVQFTGDTPLGSSLEDRILKPMVLDPVSRNTLQKPVLVIAITDGKPQGETHKAGDSRALHSVINDCATKLSRSRYGVGAVSYQIAQVGNDAPATEWLKGLDNDPEVGHLIDVTSSQLPSI